MEVPVHSDFRMVERSGDLRDERLEATRQALRSAWALPTDTFVTSTMPLLLTVLGLMPETSPGPRNCPMKLQE